MARVVVVGGGFAGMAAAARLAKLGHDVTLVERSDRLGGALTPESRDGFSWDAGPSHTLLPAVVRDLFRKSGRPLEREVDLQPLPLVREHRFEDGSSLALPGGSRAAQLRAVDELSPGLGSAWVDHVASYGDTWELLRREAYERVLDPHVVPRQLQGLLRSRTSLHRHVRARLRDDRLRQVATHTALAAGHDPRDVPAWAGLTILLEQRFGTWTAPGGLHVLGTAMASRLATRRVAVLLGTTVEDVVVRAGRAVAVATTAGVLDADTVVVAVDPRGIPTLAPLVRRASPAIPPVVTHVGLEGDVPDLPHETVLHGDPMLVVRTGGTAPRGASAWTIHGRGRVAEDLLTALARRGIDVRRQVVTRVDRSPRDLVEQWGGSPLGVLWRGPRTSDDRLGARTPVGGVHVAGAHATTGFGLPFAGLTAALVADVVGKAARDGDVTTPPA